MLLVVGFMVCRWIHADVAGCMVGMVGFMLRVAGFMVRDVGFMLPVAGFMATITEKE